MGIIGDFLMNEIKVSIIVPIYNTETFLKKCIESIVNQTLQEIEIILINDGSTDNSHKICLEYTEKYPKKIRYINNKNIGCSATRNLGIELAHGEYIAFVDSDDYIEKEMYEEMYKKASKEKSDIVMCGFKYIFSDKKNLFIPQNKYIYLDTRNKPSYVWNKLFRKFLLKNNQIEFPLNTHYCEDLVFSFKNLVLTKNISIVQQPLYNYILHGNNSIYNLDKKLDTKISFLEIYNFLENNNFLKNKYIMKYFFQNFYYSGVKNIFFSLLNSNQVSKEEVKKYNKIFYEELKKIKFLTLKSKFLIFYYKNLVFLIRKFNLYFFLKKIKKILKREKI